MNCSIIIHFYDLFARTHVNTCTLGLVWRIQPDPGPSREGSATPDILNLSLLTSAKFSIDTIDRNLNL